MLRLFVAIDGYRWKKKKYTLAFANAFRLAPLALCLVRTVQWVKYEIALIFLKQIASLCCSRAIRHIVTPNGTCSHVRLRRVLYFFSVCFFHRGPIKSIRTRPPTHCLVLVKWWPTCFPRKWNTWCPLIFYEMFLLFCKYPVGHWNLLYIYIRL